MIFAVFDAWLLTQWATAVFIILLFFIILLVLEVAKKVTHSSFWLDN